MSMVVKVQSNGQVTIPRGVRSAVGLADGDLVEVRAVGKKIIVTPQSVVDRTTFPSADDDYTPAQRRLMDARLAKSDEDIRRGRVYGPFASHKEFVASLRKETSKLRPRKKS